MAVSALLALPPLLTVALATPAAPSTRFEDDRLEAPKIRYREGSNRPVGEGHVMLVFEATNPNEMPLPYIGYLADSFSPPIPDGEIAPIYRVEFRRNGTWTPHTLGFCGTGRGEVAIKPDGKATFTVVLPDEDWDAVRVGLTWYATPDRSGPTSAAWSEPVAREAIAKPTSP
jgi:hypothetical protein